MMAMKRFLEKAVKWLLTASGFVTSLVILLIIGFLFTEGAGLFREHVIEDGYVLALNSENPVRELSAADIKAVFDEDVTNWKEFGGPDLAIETFRLGVQGLVAAVKLEEERYPVRAPAPVDLLEEVVDSEHPRSLHRDI